MNDFFAALCSTVKAEKSLPNSIKENSKPLQMCRNMYIGKQLLRMNPSNAPPQTCMFVFHSLLKISFGRCVRVAQKHFASMEFKSLHIWFSLLDYCYIQ